MIDLKQNRKILFLDLSLFIFLSIMSVFVGVAFATPTNSIDTHKSKQHARYSRALNTMAARLMKHYSLLFNNTETKQTFSVPDYPKHITQIEILNTALSDPDKTSHYQFQVKSRISYKENNTLKQQRIDETFHFYTPDFTPAIINSMTRNRQKEINVLTHSANQNTVKQDQLNFKHKQFAYAWLAFLDGVQPINKQIHITNSTDYSVKIGAKILQGNFFDVLKKRQHYLSQGGHQLRSITTKQTSHSNVYLLDITMEWKGVNSNDKPVIAKIHQQIKFKLDDKNNITILSIKEKHLLPDVAPWVGLLC